MRTIHVQFFGDSICVGQGVSPNKSWVTKIAESLEEIVNVDYDILVTNSSVNGRTTRQALEDMPFQIQSQKPDILYVQFGLNDCNQWLTDNGNNRVSAPAFRANIDEILTRAFSFGTRSILLAKNHRPTRDFDNPLMEETYSDSVDFYNQIIEEVFLSWVSKGYDVHLVDHWRQPESARNIIEKSLLEDGLHLSALGHAEYLDRVLQVLKPRVFELLSDGEEG